MSSNAYDVNDIEDNLVSKFDASTCSGDSVYIIFDIEDKIITEDFTIWFNRNKTIWLRRAIKTPYGDFSHNSNYLKLIWINTKSKKGF